MPAPELAAKSRRAWDWVRRQHTREKFAARYREALLEILDRFRPELARAALTTATGPARASRSS